MTTSLAFEWVAIAEIVVCLPPLDTDAVDAVVPDANPGISVTPISISDASVASVDPACFTTLAGQLEQLSHIHLGCGTLGGRPTWTHRMSRKWLLRVQVLDISAPLCEYSILTQGAPTTSTSRVFYIFILPHVR